DPADVPENFKAWLDDLTLLVSELESTPGATLRSSARTSTPIAPLLGTIKWNQNAPYNNMCPTYQKDGETKRAATGCVATAMAQVMYYHKWPVHGTGSNTYTTILNSDSAQTATLTANFGSTTYDWDHMTPTYGSRCEQRRRH
ncbi:MAG: C10 family peptidase, partial [Muribaculaceae bacterium]|nr:C10 family peptidase [Muribaculaceae bacterium]